MSDFFGQAVLEIFGPQLRSSISAATSAASETRRQGLLCILILAIVTCFRIRGLLFNDRVAANLRALGDEALAQMLASAGFFIVDTDSAALSSTASHRPDCPAARLIQLAQQPTTSPDWATAADTAARQHLNQLRRLLGSLDSPLIGAAASYDFDPLYIRYCLAKHLLGPAAGQPPATRPGDLLRLVQATEESEPAALTVAPKFDLLRIIQVGLSTDAASSGGGGAAYNDQQQQPPPPNSGIAADSISVSASIIQSTGASGSPGYEGEDDADDRCIQCRSRTRNRVTLPCAHFLLCDRCLESLSRCPRCSSNIAASVTAFIT